jgi:hypothetical protein
MEKNMYEIVLHEDYNYESVRFPFPRELSIGETIVNADKEVIYEVHEKLWSNKHHISIGTEIGGCKVYATLDYRVKIIETSI